MGKKMEMAEGEDKLLGDMLEVIRFTEGVSAKLHRVLDEAKIYQVVKEEFAKSDRYTAGILLLDDDGASLRLAEIAMTPSKLKVLERASGLQTREFMIKLGKSSICRQVVREGKTVHVNVSDIIREFLPRPLAYLISKTMGYDKQSSILTPLHRRGKVIGALVVSCTDLCEYLLHSVENLALHISTALELADEHAQRKRAVQALKRYHDHLGELVEERTAELEAVNEKLREEVSERKEAGEKLRESEEFSSSLLSNAPNPVLVINQDTSVGYVNPALYRLTGFSSTEVIGRKIPYPWWTEETLEKTTRDFKQAMRKGAVRVEELFQKKDGERFWVAVTSAPVTTNGEFKYYLANWVDITEHKRAEEALRESRQKFQKMFESVTDGISVVDLHGAIIETNQRMAEMHGFASKDELLGRNALELVAPRDRERIARNMRKAIKEEAIRGVEYTLLKTDGSEFPGELSSSILEDASGNRIGHITIARDITRRKQAEEALQAEKNKLQSLIDSMEYGLTIQDKDYNVIYQNELLKGIFGARLGEKCYRVYEGKEELCDGCPVEKAFKDGKSHTVERRVVMPSGEVAFWENTANPIRDAKGRIVSCLEVTRNITERKRAEEALADEATRRRILVDQSRDGIVVLDENAKVYEANQRFTEMLGYTAEEVRELHTWDWDTQWTREQLLEMGRKIDAAGSHLETHHRRKDGTVIDVEISVNGAVCAGQKLLFCVCRDVTERKRAEEALQAEKNKLQSLIDAMEDDLSIQDKDYNIIYQNEPSRISSGGNHAGEKCYRVYEGREKICEGCPVEKAFKDGKSHTSERKTIAPSGEVLFWENTANPIRGAGGKIVACLEIGRNITERRQAEEALRESQQFSSSLLASSPNPIAVVNPDTSMRYVNPAFERLTGFTLAEIAGRKAPYPWWPEGKRARILAAFKDAIEYGSRRTERNFQKKNGERFWVALNSAPVMQDGKAICLIVSWLDITERKQAEEKEKQLQQELYLAQRLASVGELAAGVAHEINNPLTGVLGFSQRLMRKSTDEEVSHDLEIIHSEARRAAEVVQSLLAFARRRQPKKEYADINDIVNKTLELRAYALQTGNIEVVTTLAPRLPRIMVDFPQMQEVFLNIILNAEQAMSEAHGRGKLIIKARRLKKCVKVSFADDGPGISPENLDKVFDPFFTTREERGGTGLGLSACHGIVTEHGGRIYARSKGGKGAAFFVELPLSPVEAALAR